jgi:hypothetical protein
MVLVQELRLLGHDLWSYDESAEYEVWGPDYSGPSGPGVLITFTSGGARVEWRPGSLVAAPSISALEASSLVRPEPPTARTLEGPLTDEEASELSAMLSAAGLHVAILRIPAAHGDLETWLIEALAAALQFPDYFGGNWNAVDECITDMSWLPARGYCVLLLRADFLRLQQPRVFDLFIEVIDDAGAVWRKEGVPFHVVCSP